MIHAYRLPEALRIPLLTPAHSLHDTAEQRPRQPRPRLSQNDDSHQCQSTLKHHRLPHILRGGKLPQDTLVAVHSLQMKEATSHLCIQQGKCRTMPPFYGLVKRATNRPPGPYDYWFSRHQKTCGGTFVKIRSPEEKKRGTETETQTKKPRLSQK